MWQMASQTEVKLTYSELRRIIHVRTSDPSWACKFCSRVWEFVGEAPLKLKHFRLLDV